MSLYVEGDNNKTGKDATYTKGSWQRAWLNWDYNRSTDTIWILGYGNNKDTNSKQKLFSVDAITGILKETIDLGVTGTVFYVSSLTSGNVMCYGTVSSSYDGTVFLYDVKTKTVNKISGNSKQQAEELKDEKENTTLHTHYRWSFSNLIPVADNINFVEIYSFGTKSSTEDNGANLATYDVYFIMVDDKLNSINQNGWTKPKKIASGLPGYRNTTITPQRDYFTLLSGKVATVIYNNVVIIDSSNSNNIKTTNFTMSEAKWIQSWTIDANENLYFKFKDDEKIYKVDKTILNSSSISNLSPQTYLDLKGISTDGVNSYANNFVIYNVYGYTGQLMMINADPRTYIRSDPPPTDNQDKWGLAIGVTQNKLDQSNGDYKGLLNTENSFQKSADFEISESVLNSKLPSEITQNDIKPLNNSFFQASSTYKSFVISEIDDTKGTFKITVNLYQIPWFASTLPTDAIPTKIIKDFQTKNKIDSKVSWKILSTSTDYDFMNMLPTNLTVDDVKNLDPFQISFQSQTITDNKGNLIYPKKEYSIIEKNDATGKVTIKADYKYVPMGVTYTGKSNDEEVLTYSQTHEYTIFNQTAQSQFNFMGANENAVDNKIQEIDVTKVPQLKSLLEANTLPSSFVSLTNSNTNKNNAGFLQFINTSLSKGYPLSKINFTILPNDNEGTLQITASVSENNSPDKKPHKYVAKYTNLNKQTNYKFEFLVNITEFNKISFNSVLASSVTEGDVIAYFVKYEGFNSNDLNVSLFPNDAKGELTVSISLNKSYASEIASGGHGFTNYQANFLFKGFMTTEEYNNKFAVEFVDDSSTSLLDFKLMQAQEIYDAFNSNKELVVDKKTYKTLSDLIENLLVAKKGVSVPSNWSSYADIKTTMYIDNSLGIASFYVKIPQNLLNGASSDLNLIANYSGFVKGNVDKTDDNLSFVT
ncbi:MAG: hypothetical protein K2O21_00460, partial [Malacoplasma sp.]|nr:hypothetical protein [Malacoplasma sp.]